MESCGRLNIFPQYVNIPLRLGAVSGQIHLEKQNLNNVTIKSNTVSVNTLCRTPNKTNLSKFKIFDMTHLFS